MKMNNLIKIAAFQVSQEPDNIIKVAGILSKIKKWILGMFDSNTQNQMSIIDSKYSQIKALVQNLQSDIKNIENAIENVNITQYDEAVKALSITLNALSEEIDKTKIQIEQTQELREESKPSQQKDKPTQQETTLNVFSEKKSDIEKIFMNKTLESLNVSRDNIKISSYEPLFTSMRGKIEEQPIGKGNVLKFFENDLDKLNHFISKMKEQNIIDTNVIPDLYSKFRVRTINPPKNKPKNYINLCGLILTGRTNFIIQNDEGKDSLYKMSIAFVLDVYVPQVDNLQQNIENGIYRVYKIWVNGIEGDKWV